MSLVYTNIRKGAAQQAAAELSRDTRETNDYDAVKKLHLQAGKVLENRGIRIDKYQLIGGISQTELDQADKEGSTYWDDYRQWCGRFIYYCYSEGAKSKSPGTPLPFAPADLWSGQRFRNWAEQYKERLRDWKRSFLREKYVWLFGIEQERRMKGKMVSLLDEQDDEKQVMTAHPDLVQKLDMVADLSLFRIWDNRMALPQDPKKVAVEPGDVFTLDSGHMGIASGLAVDGHFETIEGNQSSAGKGDNSVKKSAKNVAECSLIIRI